MDLTTPGVFALTDSMTGNQIAGFVRKIEKLGYGSFWFPEAFGRDPFALAAHILSVTDRLVVATGIANVWKREPVAMIGAARTLAELFPDRFILGIGISHGPMVAQLGDQLRQAGYVHARLHCANEVCTVHGAAGQIRSTDGDCGADAQDASARGGGDQWHFPGLHHARANRADARGARSR